MLRSVTKLNVSFRSSVGNSWFGYVCRRWGTGGGAGEGAGARACGPPPWRSHVGRWGCGAASTPTQIA